MTDLCPICEGSGLRVVERENGVRVATDCACRVMRRGARQFDRARIPERFRECTLDNFITNPNGVNSSFEHAVVQARGFLREYSWNTDGIGLLFTGSKGTGKTHLATAILKSLMEDKGVRGLFVDHRDLLKRIQDSYNSSVQATEREVLKPILEAEVLLLDELGAARKTDWVGDTIEHILNTRYNDCKVTLLTTNFENAPAILDTLDPMRAAVAGEGRTLGDRIGDRMFSRLQEMCVVIDMHGEDYRQTAKRASFTLDRSGRNGRRSPG